MVIYLSKVTRIVAEDGQNYILQTRHVRADGVNQCKAYWKSRGFYARLVDVARGAIDRDIATGSKKVTWAEYVKVFNDGIARVETACEAAVTAQQAANMKGNSLTGFDFDVLFDTKDFPDDVKDGE